METELNDLKQPWERQPSDTRQSFEAFAIYLQHDKPRPTLPALATKVGNHRKTVEDWSSSHNWADRVAAYDNHLVEIGRLAAAQSIIELREMATERLKADLDLLFVRYDELMKYQRFVSFSEEVEGNRTIITLASDPKALATVVKTRRELEEFIRLVTGQATDVTETRKRNMDYMTFLKKMEEANNRQRQRLGQNSGGDG